MAHTTLPAIDALWRFEMRMAMARNAVFELRQRYVRGYRELDGQGEQDCRELAAELALLLDDIARELQRQPLLLPTERNKDALLVALAVETQRTAFHGASAQLVLSDRDRAQAGSLEKPHTATFVGSGQTAAFSIKF